MGTLTRRQTAELRKKIIELVTAEVADSWAGAGEPADVRILELELKQARTDLEEYLDRITERKGK